MPPRPFPSSSRRSRRPAGLPGAGGVVAALVLAGGLGAQSLPFQTYSSDDGLAQSVILALHQDRDGYLWLGTPNGLSRFDGLVFHSQDEDDGLADLVVRSILQTADGDLWVGTDEGLSLRTPTGWETVEGVPRTSIRALLETSDGALWAGTYGDGLWRVRPGPPLRIGVGEGLAGDRVRALVEDPAGGLWVGDFGAGLSFVEGWEQPVVSRIEGGLGDPSVRALGLDGEGRLIVGTNRGAWRRDGGGFERLTGEGFHQVTSVYEDRTGRLWIGTRERGACYVVGDEVSCIGRDQGLPDDSVNCMLEDREGNLWFGTFGGGVSRLVAEDFVNWTARDGLPAASVQAFAQQADGTFWIGTHGGGLVAKTPVGDLPVLVQADGLPHDKVLSLHVDSRDRLWIGTLEGLGLLADGEISSWSARDGLAHATVFDIAEGPDGSIWLATLGGLTLLPGGASPGEIAPIVGAPDGELAAERTNHVEVASDGTAWVATALGLVRIADGSTERWTEADGLPDDYVDALLLASDGALWMATSGGLSRWTPEGVRTWTTADGLSHDKCSVLLEDRDGRLWIGTTRGVNVFDGESFLVFEASDGLVSSEVNQRAGFIDREGDLWFGTVAGAVEFDPESRLPEVPPPPIHLTALEVLSEAVPLGPEISLPWNRNDLTFRFVGLSLTYPDDVEYRYRVEGLGDRWRTTRSRLVELPALPPGSYRFRVEARVRGRQWSTAPAEVAFSILPPWWETWWFRAALLLATVVGIAFWHGRRLRSFRERNLRLEAMNARLEELIERRREAEAEVRRYAGELEKANLYDALTGLPNRALFLDRLRVALERFEPDRTPARSSRSELHGFAVLLIDLDRFKLIIESHGHRAGDEVLATAADRLATSVGSLDTVARLGGDEFAILCAELDDPTEASRFAERIHERLARPMTVARQELVVTASIGIVFGGSGYAEADELLRDADAAMYRAKGTGRGNTAVFDPHMQARAVEQLQLETDLRRAVERGELELRYQPIVRIETGEVAAVEALVRWRHPTRGFLLPHDFLPHAEDAGLSEVVDHWVLEAAVEQTVHWRENPTLPRALAVSVNASGRQVVQPDLPRRLRELLDRTGIDPALLRLEITEDVLIEETEEAARVLAEVRKLGVRLFLDDFGTGFSSLSYLQRFPVDVLKIDRTFVSRLGAEEDSTKIVASILQLAGSLGLDVVAEGVETREQLEILASLGCGYAQGYLFARALSPVEVEEILHRELPRAAALT